MTMPISKSEMQSCIDACLACISALCFVVLPCALMGAPSPVAFGQEGAHPDIPARVTLARVPNGGIQPQAAVDDRGILHLVYFKGDPAHGDLFYVHKDLTTEGPFSAPIRVNSRPQSAVALGTIRGAEIAIGKGNRVFVAWNGSARANEGKSKAAPMLFTRSREDGTAFEAEHNLLTGSEVIDGGGAIAADRKSGTVSVFWHAVPKDGEEATGGVYQARSTDSGATFGPVRRLPLPPVGTCGCCGMRAAVDETGALYVLYRAAAKNVERDTMLLTSRDGGNTFQQSDLQPWRAGSCPMSLFGLAPAPRSTGVFGAWETQGQVYMAALTSGASIVGRPTRASLPGGDVQKYPVVAVASSGMRLVSWAEGAGWQRGGNLVWQMFDADGNMTTGSGRVAGGVPTWSLPAAVTRPNGDFLILY